uniref:Sulfatase domain-containing protein n=1 Tax=Rhabditophanes sp. KR3021 TaxID=114890 RepID=A0AC35UEF1_9BILA
MNKDIDNIKCKFACQYYNNHKTVTDTYQEFTGEVTPNCDIIRTQCFDIDDKKVWDDIDMKLKKQDFNLNNKMTDLADGYYLPVNEHKYNVHMILIDTVGEYSYQRTLVKTNKVIRDMYKAFEFKLHHKVGENTLPNVKAMLMNIRSEDVVDNLKARPTLKAEMSERAFCNSDKSKFPFIPRYFQQNNYITMRTQDWWYSTFGHPASCRPVFKYDHDAYAFSGIITRDKVVKDVFKKKCLESYKVNLKYLEEYMEAYKDKKLFSFNFLTNIQHENINGLYHADESLSKFFHNNANNFENSFVIFMADHGVRFGKYREKTDLGQFEDSNPFLRLMLPKKLRENKKLMEVVENNSKKFTSQYDIFATLIDILTEGSKTDFSDLQYKDFSNTVMNYQVKGQSLLRQTLDRDEYEMQIPVAYQFYKKEINDLVEKLFPEINNLIITNCVKAMNKMLEEADLMGKCVPLKAKQNGSNHKINVLNLNGKPFFEVEIDVFPGKGRFAGQVNENYEVVPNSFRRLNAYKDEAEVCETESSARQYCYCKKLLKD